ncbi:MAG: site-2 protease family protein [Candidatus Zambryskibacteria bacterium]|nr:site-2 protease family protein [Candidatus Zambryskibacteria bacterium]
MQVDFVFQIAILIMSVVIHEVSHGYAASMLGDQTARYQGRLTLNPFKHLDFVGSFIVPTMAYFLGGFIFGWAKPVPYNPYNLKPGRWSEAAVATAGPASNIILALIFGILLRIGIGGGWATPAFVQITSVIVFINILLAIFNLMPIPPLDGSKLLFAFFPNKLSEIRNFFERYGLLLILFFIFFLWQFIFPVIVLLFQLITGVSL